MHTNPEVLALLALGEDSATLDEHAHIAGCAECSREIATLARLASIGRSAHSSGTLESPAPHVWDRIRAELGMAESSSLALAPSAERSPEPSPDRSADRSPGRSPAPSPERSVAPRRRAPDRRWMALALAAALALVVGFGAGFLWDRYRQPRPTVVASAELAPQPAWAGSSGRAWIETYSDGTRDLKVQLSTDKPLTGRQQVWLYDPQNKAMVPMGWLQSATDAGSWAIPSTLDVQQFNVVDVSEEPPNDTDVNHSGNTIVRGTLAF